MVVFPSLPVTPIIVDGDIFSTISISDVTIAPLSSSFCNSGIQGIQLGVLKIISNPTKFCRLSFPKLVFILYFLISFIASSVKFSIVLLSKTVTFAPASLIYLSNGILLTPSPIIATFLFLI